MTWSDPLVGSISGSIFGKVRDILVDIIVRHKSMVVFGPRMDGPDGIARRLTVHNIDIQAPKVAMEILDFRMRTCKYLSLRGR